MRSTVKFVHMILLILCGVLLSSCWKTTSPDTPIEPADSDSMLSIAGTDISEFSVIRSDHADDETKKAVSAFMMRLQETYSIELSISTDYYTPEEEAMPHEIVVGMTARSGSPTLADGDSAAISVKDGKLYFCAAQGKSLDALIELFFNTYVTDESGEIKKLHLEEGFMKEYYGEIILQREDGEEVQIGEDFDLFAYGVTGHPHGYAAYPESELETQIRLAAELGVTIYRFNYNPVTEEQFQYLFRVLELCDAYGLKMMLVLDDFGGTPEQIEERHKEIAIRCRGRIPYYQIFNETDVYAMHKDDGSVYHLPVGTGESINHFNPERVSEITEKLRLSIDVFREHDPDAKLVVNFAFKHYGIIQAFHDAGLKWDVIGVDWYSDMEQLEPLASFLPRVQAALPDYEYMICECNIWAHNSFTEEEQSAYLEKFVRSLADSDRIENLTAIIFYELLDEPAYNNGESHFGLVKNNMSGIPQEKKKAYTDIQQWLCGGEVKAVYAIEEK